ncbi:MAG: DUF308 domain-containing protein [Eubacterium sp.]|nr:DUF308 domain-containing protein [Eubacterium sp.]SEG24613.1 Uncharacterized membrane protein HdeD, DUF308 family [Eubacterium ruminantium]
MKNFGRFLTEDSKSLVVPVLMMILGIIFIINPGAILATVVRVVGVLLIIGGIVTVITKLDKVTPNVVVVAALFAIVGIVFLVFAGSVASGFIKLFGIIILVNSCLKLWEAYKLQKKTGGQGWKIFMCVDGVTALFGIILLFVPYSIAFVIGIILVIIGIVNIANAYLVFSNGYVVYGTDVIMKK